MADVIMNRTNGTIDATGGATFATTTGKVGIGITNPTGVIDIYKPYAGGDMLFRTMDDSGYGIYTSIQNTLNFNYGINANSTGYINFVGYQNGTTQYRNLSICDGKQNNILYVDGSTGNVGIGTATPAVILQVCGTASGSAVEILRLKNNDSGYVLNGGSSIGFSYHAQQLALISGFLNVAGDGNYGSLSFSTKSSGVDGLTEKMRIDNGGNVGIGTSTPPNILSILAPSTTATLSIRGGQSNGGVGYIQSKIDLEQNDASITGLVAGRIAAVSEYVNDANAGLAFYTARQGRSPELKEAVRISSDAFVGIGTTSPVYQLELSTNSAAKPSSSAWTVSSDSRLKENIELADLDICYDVVKTIPLKRFTWKDTVYTSDQVRDRSKIGWIADDVLTSFPKAVSTKNFNLNTGTTITETYEEQDFTIVTGVTNKTEIQIINNEPIQVIVTGYTENKILLYDNIIVKDLSGNTVYLSGDTPLTYQMPRMITKTRDKFIPDTIEDCLDLNVDQVYAAMYGALQKLMEKVEILEQK